MRSFWEALYEAKNLARSFYQYQLSIYTSSKKVGFYNGRIYVFQFQYHQML